MPAAGMPGRLLKIMQQPLAERAQLGFGEDERPKARRHGQEDFG
jgi:hypothetical protein